MSKPAATEFVRGLNLFDATMVVIGTMIGSGIFLVSADMARLINSPGWLLAAWGLTAFLTIAAALSYGELACMLPEAGGVYVFLREAYSPLRGFLYEVDAVRGDSNGNDRCGGGGVCEILIRPDAGDRRE